MSDFINTIDALGDDVVADAIIERKSFLTELKDDKATSIGVARLLGQPELKTVKFPSAVSAGENAFQECEQLATADFSSIQLVYHASFQKCAALISLIIRRTSGIPELQNATALSATPIAAGTGYIYVPRALVDSYKAATNWSTFADQFRALEDYTVDGTITGELDESKI